MLRKTVLIKVDEDKCENKEEIALTPISSLKPFTGQGPAQKLSTRRRKKTTRTKSMTITVKKGVNGFQSPLKHSAELIRSRKSRRSRKGKLSSNISSPAPVSSCS